MNGQPKMNAIEAWDLYDTVLIGEGQGDVNGARWYDSFAELGAETDIPFFNQRNRSGVGTPYCNFDSAEQINFPYKIESIGVEISVPSFNDVDPATPGTATENRQSYMQFAGDMIKHCALRLKVSEDEKLLINVLGAPAGTGASGYQVANNSAMPPSGMGTYVGYSNGSPVIGNRWKFAEPVEVPRNRNISSHLIFSSYAREAIKNIPGPGRVLINPANGAIPDYQSTTIPGIVMLRISMFGIRGVQQRNDLRFG